MGKAARDALYRRTTPGERLDMCVRISDDYIRSYLERVPVPQDATREERAQIQFWALRKLRS